MTGASTNLLPVTFTQKNAVAQARACAKVSGALYPIKSFTINKNAHGATNTASFIVSYAGNPDWTRQLFLGTAGGQTNSPVYIELWAGFPAIPAQAPTTAGLSKRFYGVLDDYDPEDLTQTEFHCRSIESPLTTDRITTAAQNLTTVQFIKQICAPYGIKTVIDPEITKPFTLEQIYSGDYLVGLHNLVKWDVLLRSSWFDDVDVWEDGGTLYYVHPWNVTTVMESQPNNHGRKYSALSLKYGQDIKSFKGNHAPQSRGTSASGPIRTAPKSERPLATSFSRYLAACPFRTSLRQARQRRTSVLTAVQRQRTTTTGQAV